MRMGDLPKPFYYFYKHKPVALSAAAEQKMQKLKLMKKIASIFSCSKVAVKK